MATLEEDIKTFVPKIRGLIKTGQLEDAAYELYKALFFQAVTADFSVIYKDNGGQEYPASPDFFTPLLKMARRCGVRKTTTGIELQKVCKPTFWFFAEHLYDSCTNKDGAPVWVVRNEFESPTALYRQYLRAFRDSRKYKDAVIEVDGVMKPDIRGGLYRYMLVNLQKAMQ